jgi:hypothetical protein
VGRSRPALAEILRSASVCTCLPCFLVGLYRASKPGISTSILIIEWSYLDAEFIGRVRDCIFVVPCHSKIRRSACLQQASGIPPSYPLFTTIVCTPATSLSRHFRHGLDKGLPSIPSENQIQRYDHSKAPTHFCMFPFCVSVLCQSHECRWQRQREEAFRKLPRTLRSRPPDSTPMNVFSSGLAGAHPEAGCGERPCENLTRVGCASWRPSEKSGTCKQSGRIGFNGREVHQHVEREVQRPARPPGIGGSKNQQPKGLPGPQSGCTIELAWEEQKSIRAAPQLIDAAS